MMLKPKIEEEFFDLLVQDFNDEDLSDEDLSDEFVDKRRIRRVFVAS